MAALAARIDEVPWGPRATMLSPAGRLPPASASPPPLVPYGAAAPLTSYASAAAAPRTAPATAGPAPQPIVIHLPPAAPAAVVPATRADAVMVILFLLVIVLGLVALHLHAKLHALQNVVNMLAMRVGALPALG